MPKNNTSAILLLSNDCSNSVADYQGKNRQIGHGVDAVTADQYLLLLYPLNTTALQPKGQIARKIAKIENP